MGVDVKCDVTVSKASLVGLVEFNDKTVTYNGSAHRLEIEELPFGVYKEDISYSYNVGLNAGVYNATVVINSNDYYQYKAEATLTVEKRIINVLIGIIICMLCHEPPVQKLKKKKRIELFDHCLNLINSHLH